MHLHSISAHEILAERGSILYRVLDGERLEPHHIDRACALLDDMLTRYAAVGMLVLFEHGTPLPDTNTIAYIRRRFDAYGDRVVVAVVALGLGFWLSTFFRVASYFPKSGHTVLPTNSIEQGAQALGTELVGLDPNDIVHDCNALRERLRAEQAARG